MSKVFSTEHRRKLSEAKRGKAPNNKGKRYFSDKMSDVAKVRFMFPENNPMYGKQHSEETKRKISRKNFKSGNFTPYTTYVLQISYAEQVRQNQEGILEVKCTYCGKWFAPKRNEIRNRINALEGKDGGENRFYCSDECKQECPIFGKILYSAEETKTKQYSREVQPQLRQMVFERDNYTCQKCGSTESLHCHHVEGIRWEPLESADIDKCITHCKKCHLEDHQKENCGYNDLRCV